MDKRLESAYKRTVYRVVIDDKSIDLFVGDLSSTLDSELRKRSVDHWVFVTAFNPGSIPQSDLENHLQNESLYRNLEDFGFEVLRCDAIDPHGEWATECGFIVLGMDRQAGLDVATKFGQNAILWGVAGRRVELVWTKIAEKLSKL